MISVIVPVYNVEDYIDDCIKSILKQSYTKFELILVDDGSTDRSGIICDNYASKDNRIKVIHKKNAGLSDARNIGIKIAKGEYLCFIDSDDWIESDYLQYLYGLVKKYNSQIAICGYHIVKNSNNKEEDYINKNSENFDSSITKIQAYDLMYRHVNQYGVFAWNKIYHNSLFKDIKYPVGKYYEDLGTTYKVIDKCESISYGNQCKYFYRYREGSITKTINIKQDYDRFEFLEEVREFTYKNYPKAYKGYLNYYVSQLLKVLKRISQSDSAYLKEENYILNLIRKYKYAILFNLNVHLRIKIKVILALIGINKLNVVLKISDKYKYNHK